MHARLSLRLFTLAMALMVSSGISWSQDTLRIVTWDIEHLGSPGRSLGGIGAGSDGGSRCCWYKCLLVLSSH